MSIQRVILGVSTATLVTGGVALPGLLATASAAEQRVTGHVVRGGDYYNMHDFRVPGAGTYTAVLTWGDPRVNLNLFVKNPAGRRVGEVLTKTGTVERYTFTAGAASTWKVSVKAVTGGAAYTLRLVTGDGSAPAEPPVEPVDPPVEPTDPPVEPTDPPVEPTDPPVEPPVDVPVPVGGPFLKTAAFENENGSHKPSLAQAVADAKRFNFISAQPSTYTGLVPAMKAANPNLKVLSYMNAMFAQESQGSMYPESWYLRDAAGNKVRSKGWGNYLMNGREPGWIASRIAACRDLLARGYDGCMLDMVGSAPVSKGYLSTGVAINPATRAPFTVREYLAMTSSVETAVQNAVAPAWVVGNGLGSGTRYFDATGPSSLLLAGNAGNVAEAWLRTAHTGISEYRSETQWKQSVDMLVDAGNRGKFATVMVKIWVGASEEQKNAYHRYTLASFLLGTNGNSYYATSFEEGGLHQTAPQRYYDLSIGTPTGAYYKVGGGYVRDFTAGKVVVNPTRETVTVDLGGSFVDTHGAARTTLTLKPNSAEILKR